jgi:hypothetical protein
MKNSKLGIVYFNFYFGFFILPDSHTGAGIATPLLHATEFTLVIVLWVLPRISKMTDSCKLRCKLAQCLHLHF